MRFGECRATSLRSQALTVVLVALVACGQERPGDPVAPSVREAGDTTGVLRAVASVLIEMNARADTSRASKNYPASCREPRLPCWSIPMSGWYVSSGDRTTIVLADLLDVRPSRVSPAEGPPSCPWAPGESGGYRTAVRVRFASPDVADVWLSHRCHSVRKNRTEGFLQEQTFEVRRNGTWKASLESVGVT